jgi:hypothetical protein
MKEKHEYVTVKIWRETLKTLRLISALTDERLASVISRLAEKELRQLQGQDKQKEER